MIAADAATVYLLGLLLFVLATGVVAYITIVAYVTVRVMRARDARRTAREAVPQ